MVMIVHHASASPFHDALRHLPSYRLYARARHPNLEERDAHHQMLMRLGGVNGSSLADHAGDRGGNSRRTEHSLFSEKNAT